MHLRVATWNMGYWTHKGAHADAWSFLVDRIAPDIALVQEARPPSDIDPTGLVWHPVLRKDGKQEEWGSGILTRGLPLTELSFENSHPGSLVGAEVALPNGLPLTTFSMYGLLDKAPDGTGYATTTIHRMLSDLTFVLMGHGNYRGKHTQVVLGGDLNISVQCDERYGTKTRYTHAHRLCLDRLEDFGLTNCFTPFYTDYVQTLRHSRSPVPWQNDYLFVSRPLARSLRSCQVLDEVYDECILLLSDHNPVVIGLQLP